MRHWAVGKCFLYLSIILFFSEAKDLLLMLIKTELDLAAVSDGFLMWWQTF